MLLDPCVPSLLLANEPLATAGYFLIVLHSAASLAHHYLKRDNTLVRMLPRVLYSTENLP